VGVKRAWVVEPWDWLLLLANYYEEAKEGGPVQ